MKYYCSVCGAYVDLAEKLHKYKNGVIHIRGECPQCGKWLSGVAYANSVLVKKALEDLCKKNEVNFVQEF